MTTLSERISSPTTPRPCPWWCTGPHSRLDGDTWEDDYHNAQLAYVPDRRGGGYGSSVDLTLPIDPARDPVPVVSICIHGDDVEHPDKLGGFTVDDLEALAAMFTYAAGILRQVTR